jgi:hypothetical protein
MPLDRAAMRGAAAETAWHVAVTAGARLAAVMASAARQADAARRPWQVAVEAGMAPLAGVAVAGR